MALDVQLPERFEDISRGADWPATGPRTSANQRRDQLVLLQYPVLTGKAECLFVCGRLHYFITTMLQNPRQLPSTKFRHSGAPRTNGGPHVIEITLDLLSHIPITSAPVPVPAMLLS